MKKKEEKSGRVRKGCEAGGGREKGKGGEKVNKRKRDEGEG